jgi:chromosome segregation ATPase
MEMLNEAQSDLQKTTTQLAKELKDVENLESISVKSIFHNVLGNKEEQLDKERQEYLEVSLKLKELSQRIEVLRYEEKLLNQKVNKIPSLEANLKSLKAQREKLILSHPHQLRNALEGINIKIDEAHKYLYELEEAFEAGQLTSNAIRRVMEHLNQALKWGNFDMSGRGAYYDHMKHSELNKASSEASRVQYQLSLFRKELSDIGLDFPYARLNVEGGSFTGMFFDNLITDWIMQNKIKNTLSGVDTVYDKLSLVLKSIENEKNKVNQKLIDLQLQKSQILES